eukprot:GDKI01002623.1.p1 GENE.GDKI01002623.1~~GDKI01002623.1.p1  ORF type:complete len:178 (+),score=13.16 GDKI01002623.1:58-591(+)
MAMAFCRNILTKRHGFGSRLLSQPHNCVRFISTVSLTTPRHFSLLPKYTATNSIRGFSASASQEGGDFLYHKHADAALQCIHDKLEGVELDCVEELELREGVLTIDLGSHGTFVLNKHFISKQIWYSSPVSGAQYFNSSSEPRWMSDTLGKDLFTVLSAEMKQACGEAVDFSKCRGA